MKTKCIKSPINTSKVDYSEFPEVNSNDYKKRIGVLVEAAQKQEFDHVVIYGNREHFSNMHYLTGFDPRFEDALLILTKDKKPVIIVGLEGEDYCKIIPYDIETKLYIPFGLPGQPGTSKSLSTLLQESGIKAGEKIAVIGYKHYANLKGKVDYCIDLPHFIGQSLIDLLGKENVLNKTDWMISNEYGLRMILSAKEIIQSEFSSTKSSRKTYNAIANVKEGMSEMEASQLLNVDGEPMITYPGLSFGIENTSYGLASPTHKKKLEKGDMESIGIGYRRANIHRLGCFVNDKKELIDAFGEHAYDFTKLYFEAVCKWYEIFKIGVSGKEIHNKVQKVFDKCAEYSTKLNYGHQISTEEWINSMIAEDCNAKVKSGMAFQCDFTVGIQNPSYALHVEDGIVIADEELQEEIKLLAPQCYQRMMNRRKFMIETLNIQIQPEVLPLSDMQAMMFPFMGNTNTIMIKQ